MSKQQEKEIVVNKTSKRPTRKRSMRNTKENRWYMTNPKQSESDTEKNPWAMVNPNYKFGKSLLSDSDLKKAAPFTRKLHTFYMQRGKSDDGSQIMAALRPGPMHGLREMNRQTNSSSYLCNSGFVRSLQLVCFGSDTSPLLHPVSCLKT
jgi:hypothetical protein